MALKKILLADDEPAILEILGIRLRASGYEVVFASDGEEVVEKAVVEKPDLIITDVMMPRLTGYEALRKIRAIPEFYKTPVLVISARESWKNYFSDVLDIEFVAKPYDLKEIVAKIDSMLDNGKNVKVNSKMAVVIGVEDLLVFKIKSLLTAIGYDVIVEHTELAAISVIHKKRPKLVIAQFWEDAAILDATKIYAGSIKNGEEITPVYAYCKEAISLEAKKTFKGDRLITYNDSSSLISKLSSLIPKVAIA